MGFWGLESGAFLRFFAVVAKVLNLFFSQSVFHFLSPKASDFSHFSKSEALLQGERRASDSSREQVTEWLATARSGVYMGAGLTDSVIRFGFLVEWMDAREGTA